MDHKKQKLSETREEEKTQILFQNVFFSYKTDETQEIQAVRDLSFFVSPGEYIALIGKNGSGKSSVAKLVNALELPDDGVVTIMGFPSNDPELLWEIRHHCGMVFQNPDNQIVGTSVEEDVAFGPENLGVPSEEIRRRVDEALDYVGLREYSLRQPASLSGGQKQRLTIAGVIAMQPKILLLDESTSMLDPAARDSFLSLIHRLRNERSMTVIHITHDMDEAALAERIIVLEDGRIAAEGCPGEVFAQADLMKRLDLDVPVSAKLLHSLIKELDVTVPANAFSPKNKALDAIRGLVSRIKTAPIMEDVFTEESLSEPKSVSKMLLEVEKLSFQYPNEKDICLQDVSFSVCEGECLGVIGHSGSGKTTLISHLNGLLRPQCGDVRFYHGEKVFSTTNKKDIPKIRSHVGLLFQYPEYQLFEETVEKDVGFGPKMMGMPEGERKVAVEQALRTVGLGNEFLQRSPFSLSGGQKRRVAFAGILSMNPDVLVLDEPAAGLDPAGRREIFSYIQFLKDQGKTIILISHNMDEVAAVCDRLLIVRDGVAHGPFSPLALFSDVELCVSLGVQCPELIQCLRELRDTFPDICPEQLSPEAGVREIFRASRLVSGLEPSGCAVGGDHEVIV